MKLFGKASKKAGLPPGTLVHVGAERTEKVKTTIINYDEHEFRKTEAVTIEACIPFKEAPTVSWFNVMAPRQDAQSA